MNKKERTYLNKYKNAKAVQMILSSTAISCNKEDLAYGLAGLNLDNESDRAFLRVHIINLMETLDKAMKELG